MFRGLLCYDIHWQERVGTCIRVVGPEIVSQAHLDVRRAQKGNIGVCLEHFAHEFEEFLYFAGVHAFVQCIYYEDVVASLRTACNGLTEDLFPFPKRNTFSDFSFRDSVFSLFSSKKRRSCIQSLHRSN